MSFGGHGRSTGMTPSISASDLPLPVATDPSKKMLWAGRILSGLGVAFLLMDAGFKVSGLAVAEKGTADLGWDPSMIFGIGVLQLVLLVLYLVPRTSVLGAILWVGYLGGAVATHVRIANPLFSHVLFPTYVAAFLWLRDERIRALVPFKNSK